MNLETRPQLIEPGTRFFFKSNLLNCKSVKDKYMNRLYNFTMLGFFIFIVGCILYYNYKGRLTKHEIYVKHAKERQYILEKVKGLEHERQKESQERITNLPLFSQSENIQYS